jgi:hypothetical protein
MCTFQSFYNTRRPAFIFIILMNAILVLSSDNISFSKEAPDIGVPTFLVLNNCYIDNNRNASSYGDDVFLLNSKGEIIKKLLLGLNIGYNFPGGRAISTSEDGRYFVVCSDIEDKITVYETVTGIKVWSLTGIFKSAVFANGQVYVLNNESVFAIDDTGTIVKHARIGGFDIVVNTSGDCLWIVEQDIIKCSLDLKIMMRVDPIQHGACSVDVNPDGSIWVADRFASILEADAPKGRLLKISSQGNILKSINLNISPVCVRVNKSDGSVWITGTKKRHRDFTELGEDWPDTINELNSLTGDETESCTLKYSKNGKFLLSISQRGGSISLDQSDGSIWIAGRKKIWRYSSAGEILTEQTEVSDSQKWIVIVPAKNNVK